MATFKTTHGVGEPRDLYYPNVLTPTKVPQLNPKNVQDAFRRIFDMVYGIQPPPGSRSRSTIFSTPEFTETLTVKLDNKTAILLGQEWEGNASGASWNAHTLTYNGVSYPIAADGPTTNKYIYWSLNNSGVYQSSATFPTLGVDDFLIAVYNSSDTTVYEFWNAKLAPAFISTALIEDAAITNAKISSLSATKITTGTLAASVEITLTKSDTVPAKLIWEDTGQMHADVTNNNLYLNPIADDADFLVIGTLSTPMRWAGITLTSDNVIDIQSYHPSDSNGQIKILLERRTGPHMDLVMSTTNQAGLATIHEFYTTYFQTAGTLRLKANGAQIGIISHANTATRTWTMPDADATIAGIVGGNLTLATGSFRVSTDGQGIGTATNGFSFYEATDKTEGYANNVLSFKFDSTSAAGTTNLYVYHNGSLKLVNIDASDLGSGVKNYLYV